MTTTYFHGNTIRTTELTVPEGTAVARKWQSKQRFHNTKYTSNNRRTSGREFPVRSVPRLYKEDHNNQLREL
jgi:hypothetical protein